MKDFNDILDMFFADKLSMDEAEAMIAGKSKRVANKSHDTIPVKDRPSKTVVIPQGYDLERLRNAYKQYFLADLQDEAAPYVKLLGKYNFTTDDASERTPLAQLIDKIARGKALKSEWLRFVCIFKHPANRDLLYDDLSPSHQALLRAVAEKHYLSKKEGDAILGKSCVAGRYSWDWHLPDGLDNWLDMAYDSYINSRQEMVLTFHDSSSYAAMLKRHFGREMQITERLDELPSEEGLLTYVGEQDILQKLPLLEMLYQGGKLAIGRNKLAASAFATASKVTGFREFFEATKQGPVRSYAPCCAHLVLNIFALFRSYHGSKASLPKAPADLISKLVREAPNVAFMYIPIVLGYLKGFRKTDLDDVKANLPMVCLRRELCIHADKGWLPVDKLIYHIRSRNDDDEARVFFARFHGLTSLRNEFVGSGKPLMPCELTEQLFLAYIRANIYVMAAFGLLEIAYTLPDPAHDATPYSSVRYVRLTKLGRYVLKLDNTYEANTTDSSELFELDDRELFIKSTTENNPFATLLADIATPITAKLYKVNYASFLRGCESKKDIEDKIRLFKQCIAPKPPKNWKAFFDDVLGRCNLLQEPATTYKVLAIPAEQKELQRIMLTDSLIRCFVIKAEKYTVLIDSKAFGVVSNRLKEYGYLL